MGCGYCDFCQDLHAAPYNFDMCTGPLPWRVGRKVGRTIYRQLGDEPSDADELIGVMDSADLARSAVHAYNVMRDAALAKYHAARRAEPDLRPEEYLRVEAHP